MANQAPVLPKDAIKVPQFRGDNAGESGRALHFLRNLTIYFDLFPAFALDEANGLRSRLAVIQLTCFPHGSLANAWFDASIQDGAFETYVAFEDAFKEQFVTTQSDLITLQSQWANVNQRSGDTVASFYKHFCKLRTLLQSVGHPISEQDAIVRFQRGLHAHIGRKLEERRLDKSDMSLSEACVIAKVYERHSQSNKHKPPAPRNNTDTPNLNAINAGAHKGKSSDRPWCFFCRSSTHNPEQCRKIAARKAAGTWKEKGV